MTTWMIVEDEPDVYEMLLAVSETLGNEGVAFVDGEEAVAWIEDVDRGEFAGEIPQLALLDIRLPNTISGPQVGARLRKSPVMGEIPVVLMTAYRLSEGQEKAVMTEAGADLLLNKPLPALGELQKTLKNVIARRAAGQSKPASANQPEAAPVAAAASTPSPASAAPAVPTTASATPAVPADARPAPSPLPPATAPAPAAPAAPAEPPKAETKPEPSAVTPPSTSGSPE